MSGRPTIGATARSNFNLTVAGGWSSRWSVLAAGAGGVDDGAVAGTGAGRAGELELLL